MPYLIYKEILVTISVLGGSFYLHSLVVNYKLERLQQKL